MLNVGLTGNIAAGKSSVVELFRRWGATVIDADELARQAQAPGGEVLAAIVRRFGADVLAPDGALDRAALRAKVMGDQAALDALNQIVHPAVRQRRDELLSEARERGDALVVNDIPLLFEVLDPAQFDIVVLVDAATTVRRTRLRAMRGLSNDEADRMLAVFEELRRRAARAALGRPASTLLLAAAETRDHPALNAIAARYTDAGLSVRRVAGSAAALDHALAKSATPPDAIVATAAAARAAEQAWERVGRP